MAMDSETQKLVAAAEAAIGKYRYTEAGRCFEAAAALEPEPSGKAQLFERAAGAFDETRSVEDAGRCYQAAAALLEGEPRAECLMTCWRMLILEIAGCLYDCGYEWRGDTSDEHASDGAFYRKQVERYREQAEAVLCDALATEGVSRSKVLEQARAACREREKDGWGAAICWSIVEKAT